MTRKRNKITGVLGCIVSADHKFLVTQRHQPKDPEVHGKWQLPGGGMEYGEQPTETLIRELQEEISVTPTIIFPYCMAKTSTWEFTNRGTSATLICYIVTIGRQIPRINDPETQDWKWITKDELYRIDYLPLTDEFIDETDKIMDRFDLWTSANVLK